MAHRAKFRFAYGAAFVLCLQLASHAVDAPKSEKAVAPTVRGFPSPEERRRLAELAAADRQRMMRILKVSEPSDLPPEDQDPTRPAGVFRDAKSHNWTDDAGHFVVRSSWGNWINYDEAKADRGMPLPDPLTLKNGEIVKDADTWWRRRRPEILADFTTEIYGRIPAATPNITWRSAEADVSALNGLAARGKHVTGVIDNSKHPTTAPKIEFTLYLPKDFKGPVPAMAIVGGFALPPGVVIPGMPTGPSATEMILAHGWAVVKFDPIALQADNGAGLVDGIIGLVNEGQPRKPDDWGTLAAWSWGLSRVIDYLETDRDVDARRLGIEGHSRYGKTALVAAALDQRWAIAYASCSGEGGAKLHRHDYGESVDIVAWGGEYHWMAGNFLKYGGRWNELPVDQHELIALVAPRPLFVTGGTQDPWPDPVGMFKACVAAGPVYRLLGGSDLRRTEMPAPDEELITGDLAFRYHNGGHFDVLDWPTFLKFADRYFLKP